MAVLSSGIGVAVAATPIDVDTSPLPSADIIFLGEVHGHPQHHANQAALIVRLQPRALVFEMLSPEQAQSIPRELRDDQEALGAWLAWEDSGWPDFAFYHGLMMASPDAELRGAEFPRAAARTAMDRPIAAVFGDDAAAFGLDRPLPPEEQMQREGLQFDAHCAALPDSMMPYFVNVQRLRDAYLARAALQAWQDTGGPVVVVTGTGHARTDWGAPALLARAAPELAVLSIGQFEATIHDSAIDGQDDLPHDFWIITAPHPRPDPCDAFK